MILTDLQRQILEKRKNNLKDIDINKYFYPDFDLHTFDGSKMKDMMKSVERIKMAIDNGEKIVIYSDYDSDGIPGAVVLYDFFNKLNESIKKIDDSSAREARAANHFAKKINFINYIPHRHNEGYGLNKNAIQKFINEGYKLLITVDCGISNIDEIKFAQENNLDVILTDHHLPIIKDDKQILPPAFAIINTKRNDCEYEEKYLSGCATVWKLVNVFLNKYRKDFNIHEGWEKWLLDMVAISTIADMIPLQNENRVLTKYGLEVLRKSKRPGLQKILKNAKIDQRKILEDDIAFGIAPRLNAASRIGESIHAFYALLQNEESINYAEELEKYNNKRKTSTKDAHNEIDYEKIKNENIIFIGNEKWGPGIIGLIASKIVDETGKTTFVWGMGDDKNIMKGSVRVGKDNLNVVQIMTDIKNMNENIFENFGGHEQAGGFSIHKNNLEKFHNLLKNYNQLSKEIFEEKINNFDLEISISNINKNLFDEIKIFAPFGIDNEKIIFKIKKQNEDNFEIRRFGKNLEHLEINWNGKRGVEFFASQDREIKLKNQKEYFINIEWDNYRNDVIIKFLK